MTATQVTRLLEQRGRAIGRRVQVYRLTITSPDGRVESHDVRQPSLRIGTKPGNDLVLADDAVSRFHLEIAAQERGFRIRDLGSRNGTSIDGYEVTDAYLPPRATIAIGRTKIAFEPLQLEADVPLSEHDRFGPLIGRSAPMRELFSTLERVAATNYTVLIEGESGTGKELIAEAIHRASPKKGGPFVVFDCSAVSPSLLESALFGHERGAFTNADKKRLGAMQEADQGTLFLDEVGELPLDLQPKLLRALEKREIRPLGSDRSIEVDVRFVAATNRELTVEVNQGTFRDDLYYRLAVVRVEAPSLRKRLEDLPILVEHFVTASVGDPALAKAVVDGMHADAWRVLEQHPWHGNVRELRNAVERTLALSAGTPPRRIDVGKTPAPPPPSPPQPPQPSQPSQLGAQDAPPIDLSRPFIEHRSDVNAWFEERYLTRMLEKFDGNFTRAAAAAGMDRMHFKRLLKKYQR